MAKLTRSLRAFLADDRGQELTEYTRVVAIVVLVAVALFFAADWSSLGIWAAANSRLAAAACLGG